MSCTGGEEKPIRQLRAERVLLNAARVIFLILGKKDRPVRELLSLLSVTGTLGFAGRVGGCALSGHDANRKKNRNGK